MSLIHCICLCDTAWDKWIFFSFLFFSLKRKCISVAVHFIKSKIRISHTTASLIPCSSEWSVLASLVIFSHTAAPFTVQLYMLSTIIHCMSFLTRLNRGAFLFICLLALQFQLAHSQGKEYWNICLLLSCHAHCQLHFIFKVSTKVLIVAFDDP